MSIRQCNSFAIRRNKNLKKYKKHKLRVLSQVQNHSKKKLNKVKMTLKCYLQQQQRISLKLIYKKVILLNFNIISGIMLALHNSNKLNFCKIAHQEKELGLKLRNLISVKVTLIFHNLTTFKLDMANQSCRKILHNVLLILQKDKILLLDTLGSKHLFIH